MWLKSGRLIILSLISRVIYVLIFVHLISVLQRGLFLFIVDEYGMEHKLQFFSCGCEPLAVTMTRAKLWPASPTNPRFAFTFALLDWAEACLLEAHVSLQDFCNTLKFRCPFHNLKGKKIYSTLIDSFEEYRVFSIGTMILNSLKHCVPQPLLVKRVTFIPILLPG